MNPGMVTEFLGCAFWYLACRWKAMGHDIESDPYPGDLGWYMLGMRDFGEEMRLIVMEAGK